MVNEKNMPKVILTSSNEMSFFGWTWDWSWQCTKEGCESCGGLVNGSYKKALKQSEADMNDNHWADRA